HTLAATDTPAEQDAALDRLTGFYLHTATTAAAFLARRTPPAAAAQTIWVPVEAPSLDNRQQATDWLTSEQPNLAAASGWAATCHHISAAVGIPAVMHDHLRTYGPFTLAIDLHRAALAAAQHASSLSGQALALVNLADAQRMTGEF